MGLLLILPSTLPLHGHGFVLLWLDDLHRLVGPSRQQFGSDGLLSFVGHDLICDHGVWSAEWQTEPRNGTVRARPLQTPSALPFLVSPLRQRLQKIRRVRTHAAPADFRDQGRLQLEEHLLE
jgi:hypothetical protein